MASPTVEVRHGSGSWTLLEYGTPFAATPGATLQIRLYDASVSSWELECVASDETSSLLSVVRDAQPALSATVAIPAGSGKAWRFRSRVNNGLRSGRVDQSLTYTFKIDLLAGNGIAVATVDETYEADAVYGWTAMLNRSIRVAGLTAMPVGTGLVRTAGGTGAVVPYGASYTYARMNLAGTAMEFVDPVMANGGLVNTSGQLGVKTGSINGTTISATGEIEVRCQSLGGLQLYTGSPSGLGLKLDESGGGGTSCLALGTNGVKVKFDSTLVAGAAGLGVNTAVVAGVTAGRLNASQRVGWVVDTFDSVPVATQAASATLLTTLSIPGCQVGDVLTYTGDAELDNNATTFFYGMGCQIKNAAATVVVSQPQTKTMGGGGRPATLAMRKYVVATAGTHTIELTGGVISGTASGNNIRQAHIWAQLVRPNP